MSAVAGCQERQAARTPNARANVAVPAGSTTESLDDWHRFVACGGISVSLKARTLAAAAHPTMAADIKAVHFYDRRAKAADDTSDERGDQAASDL